MSIGYACKTIGVQNTTISTCQLKSISDEKLRQVIDQNLNALERMIEYNIQNNILLFRISSDMIPFASHPANTINWKVEFKERLFEIGKKIRKNGMRVSMHPGQYTVLNSGRLEVVNNAILELIYHAEFLDLLEVDATNKLILHIGGTYGDKATATKSFIGNYHRLPQIVRDRLVIENDEKNYTIDEILTISQEIGAPAVFDNLHHRLNSDRLKLDNEIESPWELIKRCGETWKSKDGKQKIHYSQQKQGAILGAHSETIAIKEFSEFYENLYDKNIDIMLEVKDKNLSAIKCINTVLKDLPACKLEKQWAAYKYLVLSKSSSIYNEIRQLLKEKDSLVSLTFYEKIEASLRLSENIGSEINAAQHVWGYFKDSATQIERKRFDKLFSDYKEGKVKISSIKNHLLKCSFTHKVDYLLNSLYFYI